jgi:hypothetical protein
MARAVEKVAICRHSSEEVQSPKTSSMLVPADHAPSRCGSAANARAARHQRHENPRGHARRLGRFLTLWMPSRAAISRVTFGDVSGREHVGAWSVSHPDVAVGTASSGTQGGCPRKRSEWTCGIPMAMTPSRSRCSLGARAGEREPSDRQGGELQGGGFGGPKAGLLSPCLWRSEVASRGRRSPAWMPAKLATDGRQRSGFGYRATAWPARVVPLASGWSTPGRPRKQPERTTSSLPLRS